MVPAVGCPAKVVYAALRPHHLPAHPVVTEGKRPPGEAEGEITTRDANEFFLFFSLHRIVSQSMSSNSTPTPVKQVEQAAQKVEKAAEKQVDVLVKDDGEARAAGRLRRCCCFRAFYSHLQPTPPTRAFVTVRLAEDSTCSAADGPSCLPSPDTRHCARRFALHGLQCVLVAQHSLTRSSQ